VIMKILAILPYWKKKKKNFLTIFLILCVWAFLRPYNMYNLIMKKTHDKILVEYNR